VQLVDASISLARIDRRSIAEGPRIFSFFCLEELMTWINSCNVNRMSVVSVECGEETGTGAIVASTRIGDLYLLITAHHVVKAFSHTHRVLKIHSDHYNKTLLLTEAGCKSYTLLHDDISILCVTKELQYPPQGLHPLCFKAARKGFTSEGFSVSAEEQAELETARSQLSFEPSDSLVVDCAVEQGTEVGWLGYPSIARHIYEVQSLCFGHGYIGHSNLRNDIRFHFVDGTVCRGMSGAPVWTVDGAVIGMIIRLASSELIKDDFAQSELSVDGNFGLIVPTTYLVKRLCDAASSFGLELKMHARSFKDQFWFEL
jgi:hypothetical protein